MPSHSNLSAVPAAAMVVATLLVSAAGCNAQRGTQPTPTGPDEVLTAGDHEIELTHDGRIRRYFVRMPTNAEAPPAIVMALHGGGGTAKGFKDDYDLDDVADREGFIAVYPDGTGPIPNLLLTWNGGDNCCGYALDNDVDDVGFLVAVLEDLAERTRYDSRRVYVTGHSNGAIMAYRLAAEAPHRVAAIVPVAGAMFVDDLEPARGVPVLHIHSVDDPRALYDGGEGPPFPGTNRRVDHMPVGDGLEYWIRVNGCDTSPAVIETREGQGQDLGQSLVRVRWSGCADGTVVEHIRMEGVGHGWPGVEAGRAVQRILGPPTSMIHASDEVWEFASQFVR